VGKGDARAQARQVFQNMRGVLEAAGGDLRIEDRPAVAAVRSEVFSGELPASTLMVVKQLFHPDFLVEIEGVAAV